MADLDNQLSQIFDKNPVNEIIQDEIFTYLSDIQWDIKFGIFFANYLSHGIIKTTMRGGDVVFTNILLLFIAVELAAIFFKLPGAVKMSDWRIW